MENKSTFDFGEILKVQRYNDGTSISHYHHEETSDESRRAMAVACALQLIATASSSSGKVSSYLTHLSRYTDEIQNALKLNND